MSDISAFDLKDIAHVLDSPIIREARNIHWFIAGSTKHTSPNSHAWLEIIKDKNGAVKMHAKGVSSPLGFPVNVTQEFLTQDILPHRFECNTPFKNMDYRGQHHDVQNYQYALHHALQAAKDACERNDFEMGGTIVGTISPYVPWIGDLYNAAKQWHGADNAMQKMHEAMLVGRGWDMGNHHIAHNGPIEPWLRASVFTTFFQQTFNGPSPALHAFDATPGRPGMYLWTSSFNNEQESSQILLDERLQPLLVNYIYGRETNCYAADKGADAKDVWDIKLNDPYTKTLDGWKDCARTQHPTHDPTWLNMLRFVAPRMLTPQEAAVAAKEWAAAGNFEGWGHTGASDGILACSQWLVEQWRAAHSELHFVLDSLVPAMALDEDDGLHTIDATKHAMAGLHRMQEQNQESEQLALPDLEEPEPMVQ